MQHEHSPTRQGKALRRFNSNVWPSKPGQPLTQHKDTNEEGKVQKGDHINKSQQLTMFRSEPE